MRFVAAIVVVALVVAASVPSAQSANRSLRSHFRRSVDGSPGGPGAARSSITAPASTLGAPLPTNVETGPATRSADPGKAAAVDLTALADEQSRQKMLADWQQVAWKPDPAHKPVVLIPGAMGSALEGSATASAAKPAKDCLGIGKRYQMWASSEICRLSLLSLVPDPKGESKRRTDVEAFVMGGHGNMAAIRNIVGGGWKAGVASYVAGDYMNTIIKAFERVGFKTNENLFAAGYDWRHKPTSPLHASFYNHLRTTIENGVKKAGKKAVVVAHSMGNLMFMQFLKNQEAAGNAKWIETNIERFVSIAAPWIGAPATYVHLMSGSNVLAKLYGGKEKDVRKIMRGVAQTIDSLGYLAPSPLELAAWGKAGIKYDGKEYGIDKIADALKAAGQPHANADFFQTVTNLPDRPGSKPAASVTGGKICSIFYYAAEPAANLHTLLMPNYEKKADLTDYEDGKGTETDGDGTVPALSSKYFLKWGAAAAYAGTCGGNNRYFVQVGNCKLKDGSFKACDHADMMNYNQQLIRDVVSHAGADAQRLVMAPPSDSGTAVASQKPTTPASPASAPAPATATRPSSVGTVVAAPPTTSVAPI